MSIASSMVEGSLEVGSCDVSGSQDAGEVAAVAVAPGLEVR